MKKYIITFISSNGGRLNISATEKSYVFKTTAELKRLRMIGKAGYPEELFIDEIDTTKEEVCQE